MPPSGSIGIIGAGRVGGALARALAALDWPLAGVASRSAASAESLAAAINAPVLSAAELLTQADLCLLAVPDDALAPLVRALAANLAAPPRSIAHCSGALSLEPLEPLAALGWQTGGLHPLQAFATAATAIQPDITWGIEAAPPLQAQLIGLVAALGGRPLLLRAGDKTLYHAAAVVAANYALTLAQAAVDLLGLCAIPADQALAALLPLLQGNLAALERVGLPAALTGPLVRGDAGTVARHLTALDQRAPAVAALYRTLGRATLPIAAARALDPAQLQVLDTLLAQEAPMRLSINEIGKLKRKHQRIVMITAYDYTSAQIVDRAEIPLILVGDSLGMVVLGHSTTVPVTLDEMIHHIRAVVRGSQRSLVVGDLPFLTYATPEQALRSAGRCMQEAGCQAVKLEGGRHIAPTVERLVTAGIPVMGHLGYTPQSVNQLGMRVQGKQADHARRLIEDALALQEAGAFAVVLELIPASLAQTITERLRIPTIGIGAGVACDGEVQVWHDLLGLYTDFVPRHSRQYATLAETIGAAVRSYADDVRARRFPGPEHSSDIDPAVLAEALLGLDAQKG